MASVMYNYALIAEANGDIDYGADTFYAMLVTSAYVPDVDVHKFRSDVTNEIVGTGYTAGGAETDVTVTQDNANNRAVISFGPVIWAAATITNARGVPIYKRRGGLASADELVAYVDFGSNKSSAGIDFIASFTTPLYKTAA